MTRITLIILLTLITATAHPQGGEVPFTKENCIRAAIGEAADQGYHGLLAVCVGIRNRGTLAGVYGVNAKHVDNQPQRVWDLAARAWEESKDNRIHTGYMWENIKAFGKPYWADSMEKVYEYKVHVFYGDVE
jgi:hypothetical protein